MKKCPLCAEEVQDEAIKCKHCGSEIPDEPIVEPAKVELQEAPHVNTAGGLLFLLIASLIICGGIYYCAATGSKGTGKMQTVTKPSHDKISAYVFAQYVVKESLKSPSTAKFPSEDYKQVTTYLGRSKYIVSSYVDSQNSFGGIVRTRYTCEVQYENGKWKLTDIQLK